MLKQIKQLFLKKNDLRNQEEIYILCESKNLKGAPSLHIRRKHIPKFGLCGENIILDRQLKIDLKFLDFVCPICKQRYQSFKTKKTSNVINLIHVESEKINE